MIDAPGYQAKFLSVEGMIETDIGGASDLRADTLVAAEMEALDMGPPSGANFVQVLFGGQSVSRLSLDRSK